MKSRNENHPRPASIRFFQVPASVLGLGLLVSLPCHAQLPPDGDAPTQRSPEFTGGSAHRRLAPLPPTPPKQLQEIGRTLMPKGYKARPEQVILFKISAWDTNCPQHIPQKFDAGDVAQALATRDARIAELEAELAALKGQSAPAN